MDFFEDDNARVVLTVVEELLSEGHHPEQLFSDVSKNIATFSEEDLRKIFREAQKRCFQIV